MKNLYKLIGTIALIAAIAFSMAGCDNGSTGGGDDSGINGTWVSDSDQLILNNGNAEWKENGTSVMKAAYTTSGSSITFNISQMWGPILGDEFDSRWYTKAELIEAGASASNFSFTGSYTASTLTFTWMGDNYSYTKSGGTTPGGGGGGTFTLTGIPAEYNGKYVFLVATGSGPTINGFQEENVFGTGYTSAARPRISNGSVSIPMYIFDETTAYWVRYSGNVTSYSVTINIYNAEKASIYDPIVRIDFNSVTISNGSATRSWNEGKERL